MRLVLDTNILLHAANSRCDHHAKARRFIEEHLSEGTPWCLTWGIIYEFLRVSTHSRVFPQALTASQACRFLGALLVQEIVTADTDFLQFPFLKVVNPLL